MQPVPLHIFLAISSGLLRSGGWAMAMAGAVLVDLVLTVAGVIEEGTYI